MSARNIWAAKAARRNERAWRDGERAEARELDPRVTITPSELSALCVLAGRPARQGRAREPVKAHAGRP